MAETKKETNKMEIYDLVREVPKEAKKPITGGRLNGMTDIKPQWRIEKLTEVFGPVGIGWKTVIKNKEIIEGANDEKVAIVDIDLYIKYNGEWSEAIEGTGGSSFVTKEKNGLYTSDECFKMAYTDALSVACKSLGMGANVYWGDTKYDISKKDATLEEAKQWVFADKYKKHAGETMEEVIKNDPQYIQWFLSKPATEFDKKCYELLTGEKLPTEEEQDERIKEISTINNLVLETDTDLEEIHNYFKVESLSEMTNKQLKDCTKILEKKLLNKVVSEE